MPEISRFYGIVVKMYYNDHPPPHLHAEYGGKEMVVNIDQARNMEPLDRVEPLA